MKNKNLILKISAIILSCISLLMVMIAFWSISPSIKDFDPVTPFINSLIFKITYWPEAFIAIFWYGGFLLALFAILYPAIAKKRFSVISLIAILIVTGGIADALGIVDMYYLANINAIWIAIMSIFLGLTSWAIAIYLLLTSKQK